MHVLPAACFWAIAHVSVLTCSVCVFVLLIACAAAGALLPMLVMVWVFGATTQVPETAARA